MRLFSNVPGSRIIQSANLVNANSIAPSTAFVNLMSLGPFTFSGVKTRFSFSAGAALSGTTDTLRTGSFRLTEDAAVVGLIGVDVQLPADEAGAGVYKETSALEYIRTPTAGAHTYHIQWATSANATLAVDGSDPSHGGATFTIEELESSGGSDVGPLADEIIIDTRQVTEAKGLAMQIADSFADAQSIDPDMTLVDVVLGGGGAGGVLQVILMYRLPQLGPQPVAYPLVSDLAAAVSFGGDQVSNRISINKFVGDHPGAELQFWANTCIGDGAAWLQVILYIPGEEEEGAQGAQLFAGLGPSPSFRAMASRLAGRNKGEVAPRASLPAAPPATPPATPKKPTARKLSAQTVQRSALPPTLNRSVPQPYRSNPPQKPVKKG
ncbi:MAG: hypothetical protein ACRENK_16355 [Gemmatimonadaceae bacterium]